MQESESDAVTAVIKDYLTGMVFAEGETLRRVLHPRWHCIGHYEGALEWLAREEFIEACEAARPEDPDPDFYWEIQSLEIVGDTARAKVVDDYLGQRFTDILTLLKHEDAWLHVNKVFYVHPSEEG